MLKVRQELFYLKQVLKSWKFALSLFVIITVSTILFVMYAIRTVYIIDSGVMQIIKTVETDHFKILDANGIEYREEDKITFSGFEMTSGEIIIDRSFPVFLKADGLEKELYVLGGTVYETLDEANIGFKEEDMINLHLEKPVDENDVIIVQRVDVEMEKQYQEIPNKVVVRASNIVPKGEIDVIQEGFAGELERVLSHKYIDGILVETVLVKESVLKEPETELQLKGTVDAQSPLDPFESIELDDNGRPSNAIKVLKNQVATAYSARAGAGTSTGRRAAVGYVAVNPNDIPYGSKLFIETSNGGFVYGYAIAADTGGALRSGRVDVDLFFNTTAECRRFGRRNVTIYVLP